MDILEMVFYKRRYRYSANIRRGALQNCWRGTTRSVRIWSFSGAHFPAIGKDHIPSNFLKAIFHKFYLVHSWIRCLIYSAKIIKGFLKKCWQIFYKTTKKFSAKIRTCSAETRRRFLQKYWKVFCKLLTGVPRSEYKINNFLVKIQGLDLFPATSTLF